MTKIHLQSVDSTSSYLKRNQSKLKDFTFVSASYQTCGHGRYGRQWESNLNENLMFSVLIKNKTLIQNFASISIASAVAIYNALQILGFKKVSIKWPNDVYVNDKKICGILLESIISDGQIESLIVGFGLNVNQQSFGCIATSMSLEAKKKFLISKVKTTVYKEIINIYKNIEKGSNEYLTIARNNNYLLNKEVYAEIKNERILVKVLDINDDNTLKVLYHDSEYNLNTGEITFHKD